MDLLNARIIAQHYTASQPRRLILERLSLVNVIHKIYTERRTNFKVMNLVSRTESVKNCTTLAGQSCWFTANERN